MLAKQAGAGSYDARVVEAACIALQFFQSCIYPERRSFCAPGAHRFYHVGYAKNPRLEKNSLSLEPIGVATSVEALMMLLDDIGNG